MASATGQSRRRSRSQSRYARVGGLRRYLGSAPFSRHLFLAMCAVAAVYAALFVYNYRVTTFLYNSVIIGMNGSEVRYMLGPPDSASADGKQWQYESDGRMVRAVFSPSGKLARINCIASGDRRFGCPGMLGLRLGSTEDAIWLKLGKPDRETYGVNDKTIYYDGMGMMFRLRKFMIVEMELRQGATLPGYVQAALWGMIP